MKSNTLKERRLNLNLTQLELAKNVGVSKQHISDLENGRVKPSYPVLLKICKVFNISTKEIKELFQLNNDEL